jgi:hypothetical protein
MDGCRGRNLAAATAAALLVATSSALAQMRVDAVPASVLRTTNLAVTAPAPDPTVATAAAGPSAQPALHSEAFVPSTAPPISYSTTVLGSTLQLDLPRYDASGKYIRPKFYVGKKSDSMRNWMNSAGISADKCMLPLVRARTHMGGDGDVSGSLWVYARCSFY